MSQTLPLRESAQSVLDGSGNGAITIGPINASQTWKPTGIAVQTTTNVKEPVFKYYQGRSAGNLNYLGGTYTPSNDSSDINGITLYPGDAFFCVWTGGDPGAAISVTVTGTMEIP